MKHNIILLSLIIISVLFLASISHAAAVTISNPSASETITITSGTSVNITFSWGYVVDPGTTTWSFSTNTDGSWSSYSSNTSLVVNSVGVGNYTWKVRMQVLKDGNYYYYNDEVSFSVVLADYSITARNVFVGGQIKVGVNTTCTTRTAPYTFSADLNDVVYIEAIENQSIGGYTFIWNDTEAPLNKSNWTKQEDGGYPNHFNYNQATNFTVASTDEDATYQGNLSKICNLTFDTGLAAMGVTESCSIKVNSTLVEVPTSQYQVVDQNTIQVEAVDKTVSNVTLTFWKWDDGGSTQNPRTITASQHKTIKAIYSLEEDEIAPSAPTNLAVTESQDEHPYLTWDENEELDLDKYRVYRRINSGSWSSISTTSNNYLEDYNITTTYRHGDDIEYKVTAEDIWDNESGYSNTVEIEARLEKQMIDDNKIEDAPKVYALNSNYPNPFNPSTQISYQIPNDGFVSLVVYNAVGQTVENLVNENQSTGRYSVTFNASSLPSGVYFYRIQAGDYVSVKKMLLMK